MIRKTDNGQRTTDITIYSSAFHHGLTIYPMRGLTRQ